jgi:hypothetical protein
MEVAMKHGLILLFVIVAIGSLSACSSSEKKADPPAQAAASGSSVSKTPLSEDELFQHYSVVELDAAANALKMISDEGISDPSKDHGTAIIGCSMTRAEALKLAMPLKNLIDRDLVRERDNYTSDGEKYAEEHGFDTCAASCSCGILAEVIDKVRPADVAKLAPEFHNRFILKLKAKAARQGIEAGMDCARKQTWFCTSDLRNYLQGPK